MQFLPILAEAAPAVTQAGSINVWKIMGDAFPNILIPGLLITIPLTVVSFFLALAIAILLALPQFADISGYRPFTRGLFTVLRKFARFYIWIMRGTPVLVQLFIVFYGLPNIGIKLEPFTAAVIVFSLCEGAYMAETMRGALESVPKGQIEAGYCVGMSYWQIMRRIVLPQAFRVAFPALSNSFISLLKETSLASTITVTEMFMETKRIASRNFQYLALYIEVALVYLMFTTVLTFIQHAIEKKLNKGY